ncbi:hypothetical protein Hanom_Chr06g00537321 [Helianthus anomalus]
MPQPIYDFHFLFSISVTSLHTSLVLCIDTLTVYTIDYCLSLLVCSSAEGVDLCQKNLKSAARIGLD